MPAKCGSSPRAKVGIDLSVRLSEPGRPMSRAHCCSLRQPLLRQLALGVERLPALASRLVEIGMVMRQRRARAARPARGGGG